MNNPDYESGIRGGSLLILTAAILWGTTGTAQAFAPETAHPVAVGALRLLVGSGLLMIWAQRRRALRTWRQWPRKPLLIAAIGMAAYQIFFFSGVRAAGVAVGTMVAIGSAPILAGLGSWLLWGQRPSTRWLTATVIAIAGCALIIFTTYVPNIPVWPGAKMGHGVLLALIAGAAYVVYPFALREVQAGSSPAARPSPLGVTALVFACAALLLLPLLLFFDLRWLGKPEGILVIVHLGLLATAVAYFFYGYGLQRVTPAAAVTLALAEPLTASLLSILVLQETLPAQGWLGVGLLLAGLVWLARS